MCNSGKGHQFLLFGWNLAGLTGVYKVYKKRPSVKKSDCKPAHKI